ncbi:hypothetical protein [Aeromonas veronii]|uniref:hypothetical protein n=1 Tax=Aeromonas veronii TaxID=654 RepID=UPI003D2475AB
MIEIKILLVEDNLQDQQLCLTAAKEFGEDKSCKINILACSNVETAKTSLSNAVYDGAIVDMKLASNGNEGNDVIDEIRNNFRRIPVSIMTGTPDVVNLHDAPLVNIHKKGDVTYLEIIQEIYNLYLTGLTKIMGGRGVIEKSLSEIFMNHLLPQKDSWIEYGAQDHNRTEKALLRHALNHLMILLDDDVDKCFPEEMYIYPPASKKINPGHIVKDKKTNIFYIIMNPACDLAERQKGGCNTDRALLVEIQKLDDILPKECFVASPTNGKKKELEQIYKNTKCGYYHWLPNVKFFEGGVINFRRISTCTEDVLTDNYHSPLVQVSPVFLKDIVSRFSSYYARQGQPDIDHEKSKSVPVKKTKAEAI